MSRNKNEIRVGIDIGGTFTDFVLFDESKQELVLHKSLTTPVDPSYGAMIGIKELLKKAEMQLSEVTQVVCICLLLCMHCVEVVHTCMRSV